MGIERNDIGNTHCIQFFKGKCTVERFSSGTFMLSALIKERHDNIDTTCLSSCSSNDSFKILIMVIRGHMVYMTIYSVGKAIIAYIGHNEQICSTDRLF